MWQAPDTRGDVATQRLVLYEPCRAVLEQGHLPLPRAGEVLVRVRAVGVCGTDLRAWQGRHSLLTYPRVLGHEVAGEVVALGPDFDRPEIQLGDAVVIEPMFACGHCYPCSLGRYNCCERLEVMGVHRDGAMQEFIAAPATHLHRAQGGTSFQALAFVEPAAVALHAIRRSRAAAGDTAVVIGAGNIGLLAVQLLKLAGVRVAAVDVQEAHLALARQLGADCTLNSRTEDVRGEIMNFTVGTGASAVFEAVGVSPTVKLALDLVSHAGQVVLIGVCHDEVTFRPDLLNKRELDILGSRNSKGAFPEVLRLIEEGRLVTEDLITRRIRLDGFDQAMRETAAGGRDEIKTMIEF